MKNFVKSLKTMFNNRLSYVMGRIISEKIPVAFLSVWSVENSVKLIKSLREQGVNITTLITPPCTTSETILSFEDIDVEVVYLNKLRFLHPRPE